MSRAARRLSRGHRGALVRWLTFAFGLALSGHSPKDYFKGSTRFPFDAYAYITRSDTKRRNASLYRALRNSRAEQQHPLTDKLRFVEHATAHGLATPATHGPIRCEDDLAGLPDGTYILKPRSGKGGKRIVQLRLPLGEQAGPALAEVFDGAAQFVVQESVGNHPDIASIGTRATLTVRTLTGADTDGLIHLLAAAVRIPSDPTALVDNLHRGGMAAAIDLRSGALLPAFPLYATQHYTHHPGTGAQIAELQVPFWQQARSLALAAHAAFPSHVFIGWDIALTPDGPLLLEGNAQPGLDALQRSAGIPLGRTRFSRIASDWLRQVEAAPR